MSYAGVGAADMRTTIDARLIRPKPHSRRHTILTAGYPGSGLPSTARDSLNEVGAALPPPPLFKCPVRIS